MGIPAYSPALTLLFVWGLLWIMMDIHLSELPTVKKWLVPLLKRLGNLLLELIRMLLRPLFGYPMRPKSTKKRADARKNCAKKSAPKEQNSLDKPRRMR